MRKLQVLELTRVLCSVGSCAVIFQSSPYTSNCDILDQHMVDALGGRQRARNRKMYVPAIFTCCVPSCFYGESQDTIYIDGEPDIRRAIANLPDLEDDPKEGSNAKKSRGGTIEQTEKPATVKTQEDSDRRLQDLCLEQVKLIEHMFSNYYRYSLDKQPLTRILKSKNFIGMCYFKQLKYYEDLLQPCISTQEEQIEADIRERRWVRSYLRGNNKDGGHGKIHDLDLIWEQPQDLCNWLQSYGVDSDQWSKSDEARNIKTDMVKEEWGKQIQKPYRYQELEIQYRQILSLFVEMAEILSMKPYVADSQYRELMNEIGEAKQLMERVEKKKATYLPSKIVELFDVLKLEKLAILEQNYVQANEGCYHLDLVNSHGKQDIKEWDRKAQANGGRLEYIMNDHVREAYAYQWWKNGNEMGWKNSSQQMPSLQKIQTQTLKKSEDLVLQNVEQECEGEQLEKLDENK